MSTIVNDFSETTSCQKQSNISHVSMCYSEFDKKKHKKNLWITHRILNLIIKKWYTFIGPNLRLTRIWLEEL